MIVLHKLNGDEFILNDSHIETVEQRPDTVITLTNEKKYIVTESAQVIIDKVIEYKRKMNTGLS